LTYVDKTLLPWIGYRIGDVAPSLPNPAEYNFLIYGVILVAMMRFRPQGFLPSRQREAELSVHGLAQADLAMGIEPELDNISIAPTGQDETGGGAREAETPGETRDL
jgi:hypothetical protein